MPKEHSIDPPKDARAAQVVIWRNTFDSRGLPTTHIGHAALQLYENSKRKDLIDWWPESGSGLFSGAVKGYAQRRLSIDALSGEISREVQLKLGKKKYTPRPGQVRRKRSDSIIFHYRPILRRIEPGVDKATDDQFWTWVVKAGFDWMQLPDATVELPGLRFGRRWGLHLPSIAAWWRDWVPDQTYKMLSVDKNCAGAVKLALKAGGSTWFKGLPNALIYSDPKTVEDYANEVARIVKNLETCSDAILKTPSSFNILKNFYPGNVKVWTYKEWKSASDLGWYIPRPPLMKKLDTAVADYEKCPQNDAFKRYGALVKIMMLVMEHRTLQQNKDSKRTAAVMQLACRVLYSVDQLVRGDFGRSWV